MEIEICPTCFTECEVQKIDPSLAKDPKEVEIIRQAALILKLKAELATLKSELEILNTTGI